MISVVLIRSGPTVGSAGSDDLLIPPLGLLYLSSYIRGQGYAPHIIDLKVESLDDAELLSRVRQLRPEVIGIGAFTPDRQALHHTARVLKQAFPSVPLVVGGPHPSTDPDDVMDNESIDCAVLGEGEATFLDLLNALGAGRSLDEVPGLALRGANGKAKRTIPREPIRDLDTIPFPAWELVDVERYAEFHAFSPMGRRRYMALFTSRACPYQCTYCHTIFGKEFRARSPENVVAELRELKRRYDISVIEVCDDIFNLNWRRSLAVCEAIAAADLGTQMAFPNGLRADIMQDELLKAMCAAGTYYISYAVETGSPRMQKLIKKRLNLDRAREVIAKTIDAGIYVNGFFMMGFPTETRDEVQMTIDYACSTRLHSAEFFILCPFRGTEIYDLAAQEGMQMLHSDVPNTPYKDGFVNCSALANRELLDLKRKAYLRFYLGGGRIARTVWNHPDKSGLPYLAWRGLRMLDVSRLIGRGTQPSQTPPIVSLPPSPVGSV